ncbi:MAG: glycogen/starch synthase [Bacillota bacterium]
MLIGMATFEHLPIRVGGLAEAVTSLAEALSGEDEVFVFMPSHGLISRPGELKLEKYADFRITVGDRIYPISVYQAWRKGVRLFLLSNEILDDPNVYHPRDRFMKKMVHFTKGLPGLVNLILKKEERKPDLLHINDWHCVFAGSLVKKYFNIPFIYTIHRICRERISVQELNEVNLGELVDNRYLEGDMFNIEVFGAHQCHYLTTVSYSYLDEEWANFFSSFQGKVTYVWNGIDASFWDSAALEQAGRPRAERRKALLSQNGLADGPFFFNVGRLDAAQKGIDVLLQALEAIMRGETPGAERIKDRMRLVLLGSGDPLIESEARRLAERYPENMKAIIEYLGRETTREFYGAADFCVIPSNFEPFGLVQMEAMCMGCVPIGSRVGGINDTVIDLAAEPRRATGLLVPRRNPAALAEAMVQAALLLEDQPDRVEEMRKNGRTHVIENFSWQRAAQRYRAVYRNKATLKLPFVSYAEPY